MSQIPRSRHQEICDAYSFTFIRNPWDRIRSAYENKVLEGQDPKYHGLNGFPTFVRHAASHLDENLHWMPFEHRCMVSSFPYSFVGKLENDFDSNLMLVLRASGVLKSGAKTQMQAWANSSVARGSQQALQDAPAVQEAPQVRQEVPEHVFDQEPQLVGGFLVAEPDQAAARELAWIDARAEGASLQEQNHTPPTGGLTVPHKQNSGYTSAVSERRHAYLGQPGLRSPYELVDIVARAYSMDIVPFGYSFDA